MAQNNNESDGEMTVQEAGHMGGQKVKHLIEEGKEAEAGHKGGESSSGSASHSGESHERGGSHEEHVRAGEQSHKNS